MTTETMTIHQALAEVKMLDKKIHDAIGKCVFAYYKPVADENVKGQKVSDFCDRLASDYQSTKDMMARLMAIKKAIIVSNVNTEVVVGSHTYRVAEAIALKNALIPYLRDLRDTMSRQYTSITQHVDTNNTKVRDAAEKNAMDLMKPMASDEGKVDPKTIEDLIRVTTAPKLLEILLPTGLDVVKEIDALTKRLDEFIVNVDAALSTSNAITKIVIEYDSSEIA